MNSSHVKNSVAYPLIRFLWFQVTLRGSRRLIWWRMVRRTRHPRTFNDRLYVKMVRDRRHILTRTADKLQVRDVVTERIGVGHVAGLFAVALDPSEIKWDELPREFVVKVNHGSGGVILVTDDAPSDACLPEVIPRRVNWTRYWVRPENFDSVTASVLLKNWLDQDYSWVPGKRSIQWCYEGIERKVFVEQLLRDTNDRSPLEYRLFVIAGKVAFIQAETQIGFQHFTAVMSSQWEPLPVRLVDPPPREDPPPPSNLENMIGIAENLGRLMVDFVRVDVYDLGDRVIVGEMTHYPMGGQSPFSSNEYAVRWGTDWVTPY